jgi:3,4-dihydroxy 2-butanone 4-phosphate synthase/GTP cyclohydrolase II
MEAALADLVAGRAVVIVDPPVASSERADAYPGYNEGYVAVAAEHCTAEVITFMATKARGLICVCLTAARCADLGLRSMTPRNENPSGADYQVAIEAREGITTGISAADRAHTVAVAIDPKRGARDIVQPGHIFPLRGRPGGVLERRGQAEAIVDLTRMAGLNPSGVICGIMNDSGAMASPEELEGYCAEHGLQLVSVADIVDYRLNEERTVERTGAVDVEIRGARCTAVAYRERPSAVQHLAVAKRVEPGSADVPLRICRGWIPGDVFGAGRGARDDRLRPALDALATEPRALVIYLAAAPVDLGDALRGVSADVEQDARTIRQILGDLGVTSVRVPDGNGDARALASAGIPVTPVRLRRA